MFLSNLSQVLTRNEDLLTADTPLLVNMPQDSFAHYLYENALTEKVSFYDTNFSAYQHRPSTAWASTHFCSHYQSKTKHDLIIMSFPKSKNELTFTLEMLNESMTSNARVLIVGENKSGIKSLEKLVKNHVSSITKIDSARHCILFELTLASLKPFNLDDWYHIYDLLINNEKCQIAALPGVFSQAKLDKGTAILLEDFPTNLSGKILDFGTGAGVISTFIGKTNPNTELHLTDVSALALTSANKTLTLNGLTGNVFATDSLSNIRGIFDYVVTNPPFHQGIKTHYEATESFLNGIYQHVVKKGKLFVVANSFLNYLPMMEKCFSSVSRLRIKQGFTVYLAKK